MIIKKVKLNQVPSYLYKFLNEYCIDSPNRAIASIRIGSTAYSVKSINKIGNQYRLYLTSHPHFGEHRFDEKQASELTLNFFI